MMPDDTQPMHYSIKPEQDDTQRIQQNEFPAQGGDQQAQNNGAQDEMVFMQPPPPYTQAIELPEGNPPHQQAAMQAFMQPLGQYLQGNSPYISSDPQATEPYIASNAQYAQGSMPPAQYNGPYEQGGVQGPQHVQGNMPPARQPVERKRFFILGGAIALIILLLGVGGIFLLPGLTARNTTQATPPVSAQATPPQTPQANKNPYTPYLTKYGATIRNSVAQGLRLTPGELKTQLHGGKTLSAIATSQGLSASQLQTLITNSFQNGLKPAIDSGGLTQKQVDALVKRLLKQPQALDRFLAPGGAAKGKAKATPGATPTASQ